MKTLIAILLCLKANFGFTQEFAIFSSKQNIAFKEAENPMLVVVQGYPCKSVLLTTDNGKIQQSGCSYNYRPAESGVAIIKVWVKNGIVPRMIGQVSYRVKSLFPPAAFIGVSDGGVIGLKVLKAQGGLRAYLLNSDFEAPFTVKNYTMTVLRETSLVFSHNNSGNVYDSSLIKKLDLLKAGDVLLVSNIISIGPDQKEYKSTPLEFIIKN